jgi:hypothetical protein
MENITIRLAPGFVRTIFKMRDPAASKRLTMPRLAFHRKDTGWRIDWHNVPQAAVDLAYPV